MRQLERIALWSAAAAALALSFRAADPAEHALASAAELPEGGTRIAVCAVITLADELMDTDRFKPERMEYEEKLRSEELQPLVDQLCELQVKLESMNRDDAQFGPLRDQFVRLQREAGAKQQEIAQRVERKVAEQLAECYGLVRASAVGIAEEKGFDFVVASGSAEDELKKDTPLALIRDMLSRPVLKAPKDADISEDVRDDLKLS